MAGLPDRPGWSFWTDGNEGMNRGRAWYGGAVLSAVVLLCIAPRASAALRDEYQVLSEFGDPLCCDTLTQGIFIAWWDDSNDLSEEAAVLLDSMTAYRAECLDSLEMQDPPNPQDGYYYNIYIHEPGDVFPDGWGCGQGTDMYGYPYLTLPVGTVCGEDWITISHEAFHVFQYSGNAPGFSGTDTFWFVEASANWFAAMNYPDDPCAFVESRSLVMIPQVAMWLGYDNFPDYYPENWQRYVHQYAMALFLFYLTEVVGTPDSVVCGGFYNDDDTVQQMLLPQEYLFEALGGDVMRSCFVDCAARMTNDFDFILDSQKEMAQEHWDTYADPDDVNQFVEVYDNTGTGGWYSPADSEATTAWSFNVYRIVNSGEGTYSFHLLGDSFGSGGGTAYFRGKVLVRGEEVAAGFYDMEMLSGTVGNLTLEVTAADTELCFVVASMPETFTDCEQVYGYMIDIERGETSTGGGGPAPGLPVLYGNSPNPFGSETSIGFATPSAGRVELGVYDLAGRLVATLVDRELPAGSHVAVWDGRDESGHGAPDGVYLVRLETAGRELCGRMILMGR
jgi:hypothetical protein